jgi:hypothetical protein
MSEDKEHVKSVGNDSEYLCEQIPPSERQGEAHLEWYKDYVVDAQGENQEVLEGEDAQHGRK